MPSNTTNLEGYTVFSSVSLAGSGSTLLASDVSASRFIGSTVSTTAGIASSTLSSTGSSLNGAEWASRLSIGGNSGYTGTEIQAISTISTLGVAMVVQGSASSFSVFVWPAAKVGDFIITNPQGAGVSSLSSGLVLHSHCTQAGQIEVRWSNVSTLVQNQSAVTYNFIRFSV